jgi:polysaccharide export outer membrane protein
MPVNARLEVNKQNYRLGPGDVLGVYVLHQPDMAQNEILVSADGNATFNAVGDLPVAGKSLDEVTRLLENELRVWFKDPRVTLRLQRSRPALIHLSGAVARPGSVQLLTDPRVNLPAQNSGMGTSVPNQAMMARFDLTLGNVLANAGGVLPSADLSRIEITDGTTGHKQVINLWAWLRGNTAIGGDILLNSGDAVHVPIGAPTLLAALPDEDFAALVRSSIGPGTFPVRVMGQVGKPGVVDLNGSSPYLNSAVAAAGGFTVQANRKVLAIRRFTTPSEVATLFVDPNKQDIALRPNDIVFVSEQKVYTSGRFAETVAKVFAPFANLGNAAFGFATAIRGF